MKHVWSHNVIRTPIDTVNIIGAGGIDQSTITELAGPPGCGKSSYAYDTASNFLADNEDGVVVILDPELSVDLIRLEYTFKLDMTRVIIRNARTLESGYSEIYRVIADQDKQFTAKVTVENFLKDWDLKEAIKLMKSAEIEPDLTLLDEAVTPKEAVLHAQRSLATLLAFRGLLKPSQRPTPVLVVWDTIATSKPAKEVESALEGKDPRDAGGMGLRARINEINLAIVMSSLFGKPITIFLLNQVRTAGIGSFQVTEISSGGNALKHANHYYFWFSKNKKAYDEGLKMYVGSSSKVSIRKSKFGPTIDDVPIYINDQVGGKIVPDDEAAMVAVDLGILHSAGGWWKIGKDGQSYRWEKESTSGDNYISRNPKIREMLLDAIARHFRKNYFTLNIVYDKLGLTLGKLSEKDLKERDEIYAKNVSRPVILENGSVKEAEVEPEEEVVEEPDVTVNDPIELTESPIIFDENAQ